MNFARHANLIGGAVVATGLMALAVVIGLSLTAGTRATGAPAGVAAPPGVRVVEIELGDLYVKPNKIEVAAGESVALRVTNRGVVPHDLRLDGTKGTKMLGPGETETVQFGPFSESAQAWCTVPGHRQAGMVLDIVVAGHAGHEAPAARPSASGGTFAQIDPQATPSADWKPFDPKLAPAPGGTEHRITFEATEVVVEVAPGVTQQLWTFNSQTPGPILRGKVGDIFTITLVNKGKLGHSIDFHASKVAWNDEMRTIAPGESLVYQFEAKHAGAYMYHCGTAPALHHIGNGMFGAIIIDPPGLSAVDHEFVIVQSEIYLGPQGQPGDLGKMQKEQFDAVVFNGYFNQYLFAPIRVEPNQRVRVWVVNDGPSENSSFHIVGTIFDTVYKEGAYTLRPGDGRGGAQALDLQPAQGGFVEFTFDEAGLYPIVTHKFSNVGKGALGLFQAGEVGGAGSGGH
jgi:nitrite reductase (NO-forming)